MEEQPKARKEKTGLVDSFLGLGDAGLDAYMIARARFFWNVGLGFLLVVFQCMMNYWDCQWINIAIFYALFGLTMYALSHPLVVAALAALETFRKEKTANPTTPSPENINYFALYSGYLLLWLSIVSMFVTTLPLGWYLSFKEAMGVTFIALMFVSVIGWAAFNKWITTSIYKKVVTRYAIAGFLVCVWMIIPASLKYSVTGWEFYGPLGTSETAKAMSKSKRKIAVVEDNKTAERILAIGQKLANGKNISQDDQTFWDEAQDKLRKETIPSRISEAFSSIKLPSFDSANASPPPPTVQTVLVPVQTATPPVQTAMLPGEQQVAPDPPPPPKELNIQTNTLWTIQMLAHQEIWAQYYPSGGIIVRGDWIDGQYILRMQFGWAPPVIARLKRTGPKRLEGSWSQYVGPGYGEIVIDFLDERGGNGTVTWKGVEVPFQITSI